MLIEVILNLDLDLIVLKLFTIILAIKPPYQFQSIPNNSKTNLYYEEIAKLQKFTRL